MDSQPHRPRGILLLIVGAGVVTVARAMSMTFLAIELQQVFGLGPAMIGFLLGIGPLLGAIAAPFAGSMSDSIGRKAVLVLTLIAMALAMVGMALARTVLVFCLAQTFAAVAISIYGPISRALMSDICPEPLRLQYFSWRYMASNVGWTIGPMIGVAAGAATTTLFISAGVVYAALAFALHVLHRPSPERTDDSHVSSAMPLVVSIKVAMRDTRLIYFVAGGTLLITVYGQWSATLAPYLSENIAGGAEIFPYLVSINGAVVLFGSSVARRFIERVGALRALVTGCILFTISQVGFGCSSGLAGFAISMVVFTIGEILVVPSEYILVDRISNERNRGSYYGAHALSNVGSFLGPTLGGLTLSMIGATAMFALFAGFSAASALLYRAGNRPPPQRAVEGVSNNVAESTRPLARSALRARVWAHQSRFFVMASWIRSGSPSINPQGVR
jgi:MFS family permease